MVCADRDLWIGLWTSQRAKEGNDKSITKKHFLYLGAESKEIKLIRKNNLNCLIKTSIKDWKTLLNILICLNNNIILR